MRIMRRVLVAVLVIVVLIAAGAAGALWWSLPPHDMQAEIAGLSAPVRITFDDSGIPWIRAQTEADGAAALGFVHARDRMFEMELMRRAASGRLSEIVGAATLPGDRANPALGLRGRAEQDLAGLDARTRGLLEAYARGVNAWISRRGRFAGLEFVALGAPEPWTPVDSLLWGKTMAQYLAGNWRSELWRARLARQLSPEVQRGPGAGWGGTPGPAASPAGATPPARKAP